MRSCIITVARRWLLAAALTAITSTGAGAIDVGDRAPDFALRDLDGVTHSISGYASHPILLMFLECDRAVSSSIAPLVQTDLYDAFLGQGLVVLGLDCGGCDIDGVANFRDQTGVEFPLLREAASTQAAYDVEIDSFVLVDGSGVVRAIFRGPGVNAYDAPALRSAIEQILREANNTKAATWGMIKSLYQ